MNSTRIQSLKKSNINEKLFNHRYKYIT